MAQTLVLIAELEAEEEARAAAEAREVKDFDPRIGEEKANRSQFKSSMKCS